MIKTNKNSNKMMKISWMVFCLFPFFSSDTVFCYHCYVVSCVDFAMEFLDLAVINFLMNCHELHGLEFTELQYSETAFCCFSLFSNFSR